MSAASGDFLGVGWDFPVRRDETGEIALARHEESIRQAIWIILGTAKGERVMRPDFGCGIHELVFGVNDAATAGRIADEVRDALVRWEPRIDVLDVQVGPRPGEAATLLVAIRYRVRATNNVFNLVYPFYLERALA
jgi:phage baseplate assembly protein W